METTRQDEIRQAWKQWQDENPEHARYIRDNFTDIAVTEGFAQAARYLANVIWNKLVGFNGCNGYDFFHAEILATLQAA